MDKISKKNVILIRATRINYMNIENEEYRDQDLSSIEILNSQLNQSHFLNIDFSNSDMFSTKLYSVTFENVSYRYSDINSIWASNCVFIGVAFDGATLSDSTFIDCKFINCSFSHIGMSNNQFENCEIREYSADHCTITLNEFIRCKLINFKIHSTFYYQIFDNCTFDKIEFDEDLLGFNYGLIKASNSINEDVISNIRASFFNNNLLLNAAIVEINYNEESLNMAMLACILTISKMLQKNMIIKSDELSFVMKLFENLYSKQLLAPICIVQCWKVIYDFQQMQLKNSAYIKAFDNVNKLSNLLYIFYQKFLSDLTKDLVDLLNMDGTVELEMHYQIKPQIELVKIMEEIISECRLLLPKPILLRTSQGSFMEWIGTNAAIIPYVQAFISLLGVTVAIIKKDKKKDDIHKTKEIKTGKIEGKILPSIQVVNTQVIVPIIISSGSQKTEEIASQIIKITLENKVAESFDYSGYNKKNVIKINVNFG